MKLQSQSNLDKPKERFAWALRGMLLGGNPMGMPVPYLEEISEHLSKCGFLHISQLDKYGIDSSILPYQQEIHYQPPIRGGDSALNMMGEWKDISEPIEEPLTPLVAQLTPAEQADLIDQLKEQGLI